jgi:hypothetical protein
MASLGERHCVGLRGYPLPVSRFGIFFSVMFKASVTGGAADYWRAA